MQRLGIVVLQGCAKIKRHLAEWHHRWALDREAIQQLLLFFGQLISGLCDKNGSMFRCDPVCAGCLSRAALAYRHRQNGKTLSAILGREIPDHGNSSLQPLHQVS